MQLTTPAVGYGDDGRCPTCGQGWPQAVEPAVCAYCGEPLAPEAALAGECTDRDACNEREGRRIAHEVALWL